MNDKLIIERLEEVDLVLAKMMQNVISYNPKISQVKKGAAKLKALAIKLDSLINDDEGDDLL
jgi:hypothetical protein